MARTRRDLTVTVKVKVTAAQARYLSGGAPVSYTPVFLHASGS
jgi:hypothetical protein